ncbi:hypothetical protein [Nocardia sp. CC201C]|uniref:hypothetical protein n=1 Tax=Nocardia sp. CC201C TaxID=3044575 RepID=UPI0024A85A6F|nr:hypothetical protein [Nocardia sp. CC201C]
MITGTEQRRLIWLDATDHRQSYAVALGPDRVTFRVERGGPVCINSIAAEHLPVRPFQPRPYLEMVERSHPEDQRYWDAVRWAAMGLLAAWAHSRGVSEMRFMQRRLVHTTHGDLTTVWFREPFAPTGGAPRIIRVIGRSGVELVAFGDCPTPEQARNEQPRYIGLWDAVDVAARPWRA